jgi:hypothetical protein
MQKALKLSLKTYQDEIKSKEKNTHELSSDSDKDTNFNVKKSKKG